MGKKSTIIGLSLVAGLTTAILVPAVYAEPPQAPPSSDGAPGQGDPNGTLGGNSTNTAVTHSGVLTITEDMAMDAGTYESTGDSENAILMTAGTVTLTNPTITKTGAADGDNADFYGTNAAVFVSGGTLNITGGTLTTDGAHANGFFAYGTGVLNISNATVHTKANNSGAIMVTGGGQLTATYLTATTEGNSSAPIRSDRGGGTMNIEGGTYTSHGVGSPVIYSTANVNVSKATLESTVSEGVVIEGKNSVSLDTVEMIANNVQHNGKSETYKGVFIYQSMSGDADEGVGSFSAKNSKLTTKNGDSFFITNTTAEINLENTVLVNNSGDFLRAQAGGWGNTGANGGVVTLTAKQQEIKGNIVLDNISSLEMRMEDDSFYQGVINGDNTAANVKLSLSADSVIVLDGDSYVSAVESDLNHTNIYANGHKSYINGVAADINEATPPTGRKTETVFQSTEQENVQKETETIDDYSTLGFILATAGSFLVLVVGGIIIARCAAKCGKTGKSQNGSQNLDKINSVIADTAIEDVADGITADKGGQEKGPDAQ